MALERCILALAMVRCNGGVVSQAQDSVSELPREIALPLETPDGERLTRLGKL